jgi:multidrug transporter EmrE-like cation transporter
LSAATVKKTRPPAITDCTSEIGASASAATWKNQPPSATSTPISLVQSVIAGGLVFLTVAADKLFHHRVTRREWIGVALMAAGLAFLAATMAGGASARHADYEPATLLLYVGLLALAGTLAAVLAAKGARRLALSRQASGFALSAGLLWAASDVSIKAVSNHLDADGVLLTVLHPLSLLILVASLAGLLVSAKSLQLGDAVPVIAVTSAAANVCTIAAGPLVFAEPMPADPLGVAVRLLAFALVIVAASLTPPPAAAPEAPVPAEAGARV